MHLYYILLSEMILKAVSYRVCPLCADDVSGSVAGTGLLSWICYNMALFR